MPVTSFVAQEREHQIGQRKKMLFPQSGERPGILRGREYLVALPVPEENLWEPIRSQCVDYFEHHGIEWHTMSAHLLSSQVCCLNFLMPFSARRDALAALLQPMFDEFVTVLPIPGERFADGQPCHVAFEHVGADGPGYLGEARGGRLTRGKNCTSVDAMVLLDVGGRREMLLIEWKYTEAYGAPLRDGSRLDEKGNKVGGHATRAARYADKLIEPCGPLKADAGVGLEDLFYEPFYQFARQQMLAFQFERSENRQAEGGAERVTLLHIAPDANQAFKKVTAPALRARPELGETACEVWASLLAAADRFRSIHTESLFGDFDADAYGMSDWRDYMASRYAFVPWRRNARTS